MTGPITRHRDIESLKTAARWPGADRNTTVILATRLAAARADGEGYRTDLARLFSHAGCGPSGVAAGHFIAGCLPAATAPWGPVAPV
jgi:hypothetical protein